MADQNYNASGDNSEGQQNQPIDLSKAEVSPFAGNSQRLSDYNYFEKLFLGHHFEAFNLKVNSADYSRDYAKLRYVMANFAGLISKVMADMIFSERPKITVPDGDQKFLDVLVRENKLHILNYEQALANSYFGDALYKLRIAPRYRYDQPTVLIEQATPKIYYPHVDEFNVTADPEEKELAWKFKRGDLEYVRREIHSPGLIKNEVWKLDGGKMVERVDLSILGIEDIEDEEVIEIDRSMLIHLPNWKAGARWNGFSDYFDITQLFYAINNRLTKTDNILDKHSDPILAVPKGILNEKGKIKKEALGLFERPEGQGKEGDPTYVTWDASLENAFKEVDKLIEILFMVSETSPDILGMGKGASDSGRALKLKILRTVAKAQRKILYFDQAIKEALYVAQLLAYEYGLECDGVKLKKPPVVPEIRWMDGIPKDEGEQTEVEVQRIDANLTTRKDAIIRIDGVDPDTADRMVKEIDEETKIKMPTMDLGGDPFKEEEDDEANPDDQAGKKKPPFKKGKAKAKPPAVK